MEPPRSVGEDANGAASVESDLEVSQRLDTMFPCNPAILLLELKMYEMKKPWV